MNWDAGTSSSVIEEVQLSTTTTSVAAQLDSALVLRAAVRRQAIGILPLLFVAGLSNPAAVEATTAAELETTRSVEVAQPKRRLVSLQEARAKALEAARRARAERQRVAEVEAARRFDPVEDDG